MSDLGRVLLPQLDDEDLELLAERMSERLGGHRDGWLDAKAAAEYAGCSVASLRYAMQRSQVDYEQAVPGGKVWFTKPALDRWRRRAVG